METPIATNSLCWDRCSRGTPAIGRTTRPSSSRRADPASARCASRGASSTRTSTAGRMRSRGSGLTRGDRVATVLANSLELLATYWVVREARRGRGSAVAAADRDRPRLAARRCAAAGRARLERPARDARRCPRAARARRAGLGADRRRGRRRGAGYRAFGAADGGGERRRAGGARRGRRPADAHVHVAGRPACRKASSTRISSARCTRRRWPTRGGWRPSRWCCTRARSCSTAR